MTIRMKNIIKSTTHIILRKKSHKNRTKIKRRSPLWLHVYLQGKGQYNKNDHKNLTGPQHHGIYKYWHYNFPNWNKCIKSNIFTTRVSRIYKNFLRTWFTISDIWAAKIPILVSVVLYFWVQGTKTPIVNNIYVLCV